MSENTEGQEPTATTETGQEPAKVFDAEYVQQLRQEAAAYRVKAKELEEARQKEEEERLAQQQEWQELAEKRAKDIDELSPYRKKYQAILESISESNTRRIEAIPEQMRGLVPEYDDPAKLANWLDVNAAIFSKPVAPSLNGGAGGSDARGKADTLTADELATAKKMRISPEQYAQYKRGK